jgi:hypothetical protein
MVLQARVRRLELELEERDRRSHVTH